MRGKIAVKKSRYGTFRGFINIKNDMYLKEVELSGRRGKLKVRVRSDNPQRLTCIVGEDSEQMTSFDFYELEGGQTFKVTGKDFDTSEFVRWSCSFQKENWIGFLSRNLASLVKFLKRILGV